VLDPSVAAPERERVRERSAKRLLPELDPEPQDDEFDVDEDKILIKQSKSANFSHFISLFPYFIPISLYAQN